MRISPLRLASLAMRFQLEPRRLPVAMVQRAHMHNRLFPQMSLQAMLAYIVLRWSLWARPGDRENTPKIARSVLEIPRLCLKREAALNMSTMTFAVKVARNARHYDGMKGLTLSITARLRGAMGHLMEKAMETQLGRCALSPGFVASAGRVPPRALMQA